MGEATKEDMIGSLPASMAWIAPVIAILLCDVCLDRARLGLLLTAYGFMLCMDMDIVGTWTHVLIIGVWA